MYGGEFPIGGFHDELEEAIVAMFESKQKPSLTPVSRRWHTLDVEAEIVTGFVTQGTLGA